MKQNLAVTMLLLAFAVALHQFLTWGKWFELKDALHHEFFIALLASMGIFIAFVDRRKRRNG